MVRHYILVITLIALGCATSDTAVQPGETASNRTLPDNSKADGVAERAACTITLCLTGALNQDTPSNQHFKNLCGDSRLKGVVNDCGPFGCNNSFDSFFQFPLLTVYPALVDALDRNQDGRVDEDDPSCEVNLLGFSWGGVNALSVAKHLANDDQIAETRKRITRVVLLDAFQPLSQGRMDVPQNVAQVRSFRHSIAPEDDCSHGVIWGPYRGFGPLCESDQDCVDFDYSEFPDSIFIAQSGPPFYGNEVGHCDVPNVAHEAAIEFLNNTP